MMRESNLFQQFPSTSWANIHKASSESDCEQQEALRRFYETYKTPLTNQLLRLFAMSRNDAKDLLHDFFKDKVLKDNVLGKADPSKGRLRSFLLQTLKHYAINRYRRDRKKLILQNAEPIGEASLKAISSGEERPDQMTQFDVEWAMTTVGAALKSMRKECLDKGQESIWNVFERQALNRLLADQRPQPYNQFAEQNGFESPQKVFNALTTAKRKFKRLLQAVLESYLKNEAEITEETRNIIAVLSTAEAWENDHFLKRALNEEEAPVNGKG